MPVFLLRVLSGSHSGWSLSRRLQSCWTERSEARIQDCHPSGNLGRTLRQTTEGNATKCGRNSPQILWGCSPRCAFAEQDTRRPRKHDIWRVERAERRSQHQAGAGKTKLGVHVSSGQRNLVNTLNLSLKALKWNEIYYVLK